MSDCSSQAMNPKRIEFEFLEQPLADLCPNDEWEPLEVDTLEQRYSELLQSYSKLEKIAQDMFSMAELIRSSSMDGHQIRAALAFNMDAYRGRLKDAGVEV